MVINFGGHNSICVDDASDNLNDTNGTNFGVVRCMISMTPG